MPEERLSPETVVAIDGYLKPNADQIVKRHDLFRKVKDDIELHEGGYDSFTKGYLKFWVECWIKWRGCLQRMGSKRTRGISNRRFQ